MQLKPYQTDTLSTLRRFFETARIAGPQTAYATLTREPELAGRLGRYAGAYAPLDGLPEVPSVCLRLPTGGGKTLLAAHAVAVARDAWIEKDHPAVLWLVPSNTIRSQTVEALRNPRHPCRQALDAAFGGRVRVFDIADFAQIRPPELRDHCCLVVGTIQTLRVKSTEGRKVYAHNEHLEPHFSTLPDDLPGLERLDSGRLRFSFANLLHLHRPLMIVDEAHNAVTGLTRDMQARVNPSAIIEFTATPRPKSNILYSVTAQELKAADMITLPIMLSEHDNWQNAVNAAIARRAALAEAAGRDADYIRPIVLFQAQKKSGEVTARVLKAHLTGVEHIPASAIAVATGEQRELDGLDLFDRRCPIEYIITVEALKEGWDCSFAYVFCSVSRIHSATDVEQLLGRVLRMPFASRRPVAELNRAYACLSEPSAGEAARALADRLVAMGFEEDEAHDSIEPVQEEPGALFSRHENPGLTFRQTLPATPELVAALAQAEQAEHALTVRKLGGGRLALEIVGPVDAGLERAVCAALPEAEGRQLADSFARHRQRLNDRLSPAERGEPFEVPLLMVDMQGGFECADSDVFMEFHDWSLLAHSPRLSEAEFSVRETVRSFEIDLDGQRVTYQFAGEQEQIGLNVAVAGWTPEKLVLWLDRQVRGPDIGQGELLRWLSDLVHHLTVGRGIPVAALMRCKFILMRKIRDKLNAIRRQERERAYQRYLLSPGARPEVSFANTFAFRAGMYQDRRCYRGPWKPARHFLGPAHVPAFDGADDGEERRCAEVLDHLPGVQFWLRNVAGHPASFWLPTATGRFYPDFVARLDDGRLLVVEYKGAHLADGADTAEKRTVGELWQRASAGRGLFSLVEHSVDGKDMRRQLLECVEA